MGHEAELEITHSQGENTGAREYFEPHCLGLVPGAMTCKRR